MEFNHLTLLLDLMLLQRDVYRYLLYNRSTKPRKLVGRSNDDKKRDSEAGSKIRDEREKVWMFFNFDYSVAGSSCRNFVAPSSF